MTADVLATLRAVAAGEAHIIEDLAVIVRPLATNPETPAASVSGNGMIAKPVVDSLPGEPSRDGITAARRLFR